MSLEKAFRVLGRSDTYRKYAAAGEDYSFTDRNATFCAYVNAHVKQASKGVLQQCRDHAHFWGITDECEQAIAKLGEYKEPELREGDFALVADGVRKYAAYDETSTFQSAVDFVEHRASYPLAWRKIAAAKLLARADKYGVTLPEYVDQALHKTAGLGFPSEESIEEALVCRLNHIKQAAVAEQLGAALKALEDPTARFDDDTVKLAMETLEAVDVDQGLTDLYGHGVDLPEELIGTTTSSLEKIAGTTPSVKLINGRVIDVDDLTKEALDAIDPRLSKMASSELVDVLATLPKSDADLLVRLI